MRVRGPLVLALAGICLNVTAVFADPQPSVESNPAEIRAAVERAIPLMEQGAQGTLEERSCFTCHHTAAAVFALDAARQRGFEIDSELFEDMLEQSYQQVRVAADLPRGRERPGDPDMSAWALATLDRAGWTADSQTDRAVDYLLQYNDDLPNWAFRFSRPPTAGSDFTSTWICLRAITRFADDPQQIRAELRAADAETWLKKTPAADTEDRVYKLRCLDLIGYDAAAIRLAAQDVLASQRADGGWAQLPDQESDAYATATALAALVDTRQVAIEDEAWRRGLAYLLGTQLEDGTWFVKTRSPPFQRFYESNFPHGKDQFISYSATAWSVYALVQTLPEDEGFRAPYLTAREGVQAELSRGVAGFAGPPRGGPFRPGFPPSSRGFPR